VNVCFCQQEQFIFSILILICFCLVSPWGYQPTWGQGSEASEVRVNLSFGLHAGWAIEAPLEAFRTNPATLV
jgi:hypothetical protein